MFYYTYAIFQQYFQNFCPIIFFLEALVHIYPGASSLSSLRSILSSEGKFEVPNYAHSVVRYWLLSHRQCPFDALLLSISLRLKIISHHIELLASFFLVYKWSNNYYFYGLQVYSTVSLIRFHWFLTIQPWEHPTLNNQIPESNTFSCIYFVDPQKKGIMKQKLILSIILHQL